MHRGIWLAGLLTGWAWAQSAPEAFRVESIDLEGPPGLLEPALTESILAPFRGRDLTVEQLQQAVSLLNAELQKSGYLLARVRLPIQEIVGGRVRLELSPGAVDQIRVEGNEFYSDDFLRSHVEAVFGPERSLREADLQEQLLILRDYRDLKVTAVFQPSPKAGQSDLTLSVEDALPLHGGLNYDNFGTPFTDVHRVTPHLSIGSLACEGDQLGLRYLFGLPDNRANFLSANYSAPLGLHGDRISVAFANGASTLGRELQVLDIRGRAAVYSLQWNHALERSPNSRQDFSIGYAYKEFDNSLLGLSTGRDRYHSLSLSYAGDFTDLDGRTFVNLGYTQGLAGTSLDNGLGTLGTRPGFSKLTADLARVQNVSEQFFLLLRSSGQWSPSPLYVAEQYALGGVDSVRGFTQAQFLGDQGYSLSAEMRWLPWEERRDIQLAAFLDHGYARVLQPQPGQLSSQSLTGAGLGLRFSLGSAAQFRLDAGWPIRPSENARGDRPVFYGQVMTEF